MTIKNKKNMYLFLAINKSAKSEILNQFLAEKTFI